MKKKLTVIITALSALTYSAIMSGMTAFAVGEESAATTAASTATQAETGSVFWTLIFPLIIMFVLLYFMVIRPQKKRDGELKTMQESLEVGDEIVTGGGIVGIVVSTGDDTVVIETGGARHKLRIKTWAITENVTAQERVKALQSTEKKKKESALASAGVVSDEPEKKPKKLKKIEENNGKDKDKE
ncbi:MAG: preprotein translocase subunit YajC [Prevotella sp.]|nr:preprotein translocase subunit YajC [Alistipes senegalensis]MCM1358827.1 preprotein translocase subunit YajC [Prevotella sp.]MCM1473704.1 preprotein translocase subunit YajC [Muribaculaceae bacterium]